MESTDKSSLGPLYEKHAFWKAILEYEVGAWVLLAFGSLGIGAMRWQEAGTWVAGMERGSIAFALVGVVLLVAGFLAHRRKDRTWRIYMRAKHGPGSEW